MGGDQVMTVEPLNEVGALIKEIHRSCGDTTKSLQLRRGPSPNHAGPLISDWKSPELGRINVCCL